MTHARACAGSSAGMIPSVRGQQLERLEHLGVAGAGRTGPADARRGGRARARRPDSRARPRSSAPRAPDRARPAAGTTSTPCTTPGMPWPMAAPPAASTPTSCASVSTKPAKVPAAFDPPPTQATTAVGIAPVEQHAALRLRLVAHDALELPHHPRVRVRAHHRAEAVVRRLDRRHPVAHRLVDRVLERAAPRRHRPHLGAEQLHAEHVEGLALDVDLAHVHDALQPNNAAAVAVATPCWPAPVSAIDARLPMRRVSSAWPMTLLILCEPVCVRSSRLSSTRTPSCSDSRWHSVTGVGRPA